MMPWGDIPRELNAMSPEDRRVFNRWLTANALIGALITAGFMTMAIMAVIYPNPGGPRDTLEAQRATDDHRGDPTQRHAIKSPPKVVPAAAR
jgi:hypothetical protein